MLKNELKYIILRIMVWKMKWMTRYLGFIARPLISIYGDNEVIACGLRDLSGKVHIIYTPDEVKKEYGVLLKRE